MGRQGPDLFSQVFVNVLDQDCIGAGLKWRERISGQGPLGSTVLAEFCLLVGSVV